MITCKNVWLVYNTPLMQKYEKGRIKNEWKEKYDGAKGNNVKV